MTTNSLIVQHGSRLAIQSLEKLIYEKKKKCFYLPHIHLYT